MSLPLHPTTLSTLTAAGAYTELLVEPADDEYAVLDAVELARKQLGAAAARWIAAGRPDDARTDLPEPARRVMSAAAMCEALGWADAPTRGSLATSSILWSQAGYPGLPAGA